MASNFRLKYETALLQAAMAPGSPSRSLPDALCIPVVNNIRLWCHPVWMPFELEFESPINATEFQMKPKNLTETYRMKMGHCHRIFRLNAPRVSSAAAPVRRFRSWASSAYARKTSDGRGEPRRSSNLWSSPKDFKNQNSPNFRQVAAKGAPFQRFRMG